MGSGASKKLTCPNDYDQEKFNMILKLYDRLDSNGDQVIETLELKDIANLHIKNRKTELSKLKLKEQQDYNYELEQARLKHEKDVADLGLIYDKNVETINNSHISKDAAIINRINELEQLCEEKKCQTFLDIVSSDGKHIEFWKFFDYMRNRTQDIKNIDFSC